MKKFTFFFLYGLFLFTLLAHGSNPTGNNHVLNTPFYEEHFTNGIPATWQNQDNAASGVVWRYTSTGAGGSGYPFDDSLSVMNTSAADGYVILDSDSAFGLQGDALLISDPVDC